MAQRYKQAQHRGARKWNPYPSRYQNQFDSRPYPYQIDQHYPSQDDFYTRQCRTCPRATDLRLATANANQNDPTSYPQFRPGPSFSGIPAASLIITNKHDWDLIIAAKMEEDSVRPFIEKLQQKRKDSHLTTLFDEMAGKLATILKPQPPPYTSHPKQRQPTNPSFPPSPPHHPYETNQKPMNQNFLRKLQEIECNQEQEFEAEILRLHVHLSDKTGKLTDRDS
jgi:hypothetical protein